MRKLLLSVVLLSYLSVAAVPHTALGAMYAADISSLNGRFQVNDDTAIPGTVLKSGSYVIRVVDRLSDRSILRVENESGKVLSTFLAVPNRSLAGYGGQGPVPWTGGGDSKALRGFNFPSAYSVEFVYPKAEAVKIAVKHAAAVEAIDPPSDNLPSKQRNLSTEDMRIVTLWTLSPTRVNGADAIAAAKYKPAETAAVVPQVVAQNESPAGLPTPRYASAASTSRPSAVVSTQRREVRRPVATSLPHTASDLPLVLLAGFASLVGLVTLRARNLFAKS